MTGKEFLKQIRDINITILALTQEVERIQTALTSTTIKPKEVDVQTSGQADPMAERIIEKVEYEEKIKRLILEQFDIKSQALDMMGELDAMYKNILLLRYVNCKSIKEIMDVYNLGRAAICKRLNEAEDEFDTIYSSKERHK